MTPQPIECAQQIVLIREPALVFCNDCGAVAVGAKPERVA
jgi:hypothetical protein